MCREHNAFLETVAGEVEQMSARHKECMQEQMRLDEESLERVKAQEAKAKVCAWQHVAPGQHS